MARAQGVPRTRGLAAVRRQRVSDAGHAVRRQGQRPRPCTPALWLGALAASAATATARPPGVEVARLFGNMNKYAYYFTDLMVGSPYPQETSVIVDTGSRLLGFPCSGCDHCGHHIDAPFNLTSSKSARWLPCDSSCVGECVNDQCTYRETYSEGSSISGRWFDDVVTLGDPDSHNAQVRARMGCHENENKLFYTQRANGIMGLAPWGTDVSGGGGPAFILQDFFKDKAHVNSRVFSLCLASWGGELTVGGYDPSYHLPGSTVQWTPMTAMHYYFVYPESLEFEGGSPSVLALKVAASNADFGATIIDSGTTFTYLPSPVYHALVNAINTKCGSGACGGATREGSCFRLRDPTRGPVGFPNLVMHLRGGARIEWPAHGYLHERGQAGVWCETFMENNLFQTVLGISWMLHKDVIFDIEKQRLGVVRANCPEHHKGSDYILQDEIVNARLGDALLRSADEARAMLAPTSFIGRHVGGCLVVAAGVMASIASISGWFLGALRMRTRARRWGLGRERRPSALLPTDAETACAAEAEEGNDILWTGHPFHVEPL